MKNFIYICPKVLFLLAYWEWLLQVFIFLLLLDVKRIIFIFSGFKQLPLPKIIIAMFSHSSIS